MEIQAKLLVVGILFSQRWEVIIYILQDGLSIQDDTLRCQLVKMGYDAKEMESWCIGVEQRIKAFKTSQ